MRRSLVLVAAVPVLLFAACGDDDDDEAATVSVTIPVEASVPDGTVGAVANVVTVHASDYKYEGLPTSAPVGTQFVLQNDSTGEAHEMIVIRIPDGEDRTIGQLAALPEAESDKVFEGIDPATVIVALPGQAGVAVEGDGTVDEAGRYAVVCFLPKGGDPAALAEAMENPDATGPPDLGTGPPHITQGMYAEIVIGG